MGATVSKEPFEGERLERSSIPWRESIWREFVWKPRDAEFSLLRVLVNGVVVALIVAATILFVGAAVIALIWIGQWAL